MLHFTGSNTQVGRKGSLRFPELILRAEHSLLPVAGERRKARRSGRSLCKSSQITRVNNGMCRYSTIVMLPISLSPATSTAGSRVVRRSCACVNIGLLAVGKSHHLAQTCQTQSIHVSQLTRITQTCGMATSHPASPKKIQTRIVYPISGRTGKSERPQWKKLPGAARLPEVDFAMQSGPRRPPPGRQEAHGQRLAAAPSLRA